MTKLFKHRYFLIKLMLCCIFFCSYAKSETKQNNRPIERALNAVVSLYVEQHPIQGQNPEGGRSAGSGFFISKDGLIVTNAHVVQNASTIRVILTDGRERIGKIVGIDAQTDLALLAIEREETPFLEFARRPAQVGDRVYAIGNGFGLPNSLTTGIVSALHRAPNMLRIEDFIQTDSAINVGNSGGPLINRDGRVIGVNSALIGINGGNNGVGFAIPYDITINIISQLAKYGSTKPSKAGVITQEMTASLAEILKTPRAVLVSQVVPGSAADKASVKTKDVITHVNSTEVVSTNQLRALIYTQRQGSDIKLSINRRGKSFDTTLKTTSESQMTASRSHSESGIFAGVAMVNHEHLDINGQIRKGIRVLQVAEGSPAWLAGLMQGDIITKVEQQRTDDIHSLKSLTQPMKNQKVLIEVIRGDAALFLAMSS